MVKINKTPSVGAVVGANEFDSRDNVASDADSQGGLLGMLIDNYTQANGDIDSVPCLMEIRHGRDKRYVPVSISQAGLNLQRAFDLIEAFNNCSRGKVIRLWKLYVHHNNTKSFDTLPMTAGDNNGGLINFKFFQAGAETGTNYSITVPWLDKDKSEAFVLNEFANKITALGFGVAEGLANGSVSITKKIFAK